MSQISDRGGARNDRVLVAAILFLAIGCVRAPIVTTPPAGPLELWVDAFAPEGGDGGVSAALKQLPALSQPAHLHLRSGLYRGPFSFPGGTHVEGHGEAVLFVEGPEPVVTASAPLSLSRLRVQGGGVGVLATAPVSLSAVKFSGHRVAGVQVLDAGVTGEHLEFTSSVASVVGLDAVNALVSLEDVKVLGPMMHGVRTADSDVKTSKLTSEGPATALQTIRGTLEATGLQAAGGMRAAISVSKTRATISGVKVTGHEFAVLGLGGEVQMSAVVSRGAVAGGVSLVDSKATLKDVTIERAGHLGGVQLLGAESTVDRLTVTDTWASGLLVRKGKATIGAIEVRGIHGERGLDGTLASGDAVQVRDAEVTLARLDASDLDGAGVYASNFGLVRAGVIEVSNAGFGAVVVERKSRLTAERIVSRGSRGPSVAVPEDGVLVVKSLTAQGGDVAVWADCDSGSRVTVQQVTEGTTLPRLRCLLGPAPAP